MPALHRFAPHWSFQNYFGKLIVAHIESPRVSLSYDSEIPNPMADSAGHGERIAYRSHKEGSNRRSLWIAAGMVPA